MDSPTERQSSATSGGEEAFCKPRMLGAKKKDSSSAAAGEKAVSTALPRTQRQGKGGVRCATTHSTDRASRKSGCTSAEERKPPELMRRRAERARRETTRSSVARKRRIVRVASMPERRSAVQGREPRGRNALLLVSSLPRSASKHVRSPHSKPSRTMPLRYSQEG